MIFLLFRFSRVLSELSELFMSISSFEEDHLVNENIVSEDFDKLILLMSQASTSLATVVHFLKTLVVNSPSQSFDHFVETPKNVSKRRKKKNRGSDGSSFEESLQLQPLDETNMENNLNRLSGGIIQESPTGVTVQAESPCPPHHEFTKTDPTENQINERLQPKTPIFCHKDSDYDRSKDTPNFSLKLSTFKDKLFSEPISPIVSLQPGENQVVRPNTRPLTPANSTLNASGEELKEKDSVEGSVLKIEETRSSARISFGEADYFYFQRCQGWSSVCKDGGNTLGMLATHFHCLTKTIQEDSDSSEMKGSESVTESNDQLSTDLECLSLSSSSDPFVNPERKRSQNNSLHQLQESDYSLDTSKFDKKGELGTRGMERITPRKRRALLKSCSVQLDPKEAEELREIRVKRESVGCDCYGGKCESDSCFCAGEGILCHQVCTELYQH